MTTTTNFTAFIKVNNVDFPELVEKVEPWLVLDNPSLIRIDGYDDMTAQETTMRAMKMLARLGLSIIVQNHTTVNTNTFDLSCVKQCLGI